MEALSDEELDAEMRICEEEFRRREEEFQKRKEEIRQLKELKKSKCQRKSSRNENEPDMPSTSTQGTVSNSALPSNPNFQTYKKRQGTSASGVKFEQAMCALYALKLSLSEFVKEFKMAANDADEGDFDDIRLEVTFGNGKSQKFLFQLKYKETKKINRADLESESHKNDFSIWKYIRAISRKEDKKSTVYILHTNSATQLTGSIRVPDGIVEECKQPKSADFLRTQRHKDVIFKVNSKGVKQRFFLFAAQMEQNKIEDKVNATLRNLLTCDIHGSYTSYIRHWWSGNFILTKHDVFVKIAELAFSPYLQNLTEQKYNDKTESLKRAINNFPVTIVREGGEDIVTNIWKSDDCPTDVDIMRKVRLKYGLNEHQKAVLLWYLGKLPLFVRVDQSNEEVVMGAMKLLARDMGDKKIVLCGDVIGNYIESWITLKDLSDIMEKCKETKFYSDIVQNFRISFQGRGTITLETLIGNDEDVAKLIGIEELLKMSQREHLLVGNQKEELPVLHIPRTISPHFVKTENILNLQSSRDTQIILNCDEKFSKTLSEASAIHTMELSEYMSGTISKRQENVILLSTISKCTPLQFEKVREVSKKGNVYLFQHFDDGYCILMSRSGRELQSEATDIRTEAVKEREIFKYYNTPLHVLCAPPGMGKSTLMRVLYGTCPSDSLAVHVSLINCNSFLAKQPTFEEMFERFLHVDGMEKHLFQRLQEHFRRKQKLYMFLDGLDEVNSRHVEQILNFVKRMSSEGVNIWVSSRENLREKIGKTLNVVLIDIEALDEDEQAGYISSKLAQDYISEEEIETIKMTVFQSTNLNQAQNLLGIPLQLHIITEMFLRDRESFENLKKRNFFVLTNMYKTFFEGKIKFAYRKLVDEDQEQQLGHLKYILQGYELLALKTCLNDEDYQKLNLDTSEGKDFLKLLKAEGDKNGIIKTVNQNDEAIFNHQTFAEYFSCVWLNKNRSKIGLLRDIIFTEKYENLRVIFDVMLAENNPLHLAVIYEDLEQVEEHIEEIDRKDGGGRSVFHLAFSYGQKYKRHALPYELRREAPRRAKMIDRLLEEGRRFEETDNLFDFDCVRYALRSECLYPIERMLGRKLLTFDKVKESLKHYGARHLMDLTARCGYPNLFSELIKENRYLPEAKDMLQPAIWGCPYDVCTPPREGNIQVVDTIIANSRNGCDARIINDALYVACSGKYFDMLEMLITNDAQCKNGNTILHLLVGGCRENCFNEIADAIKKFNVDVNARNDYGVAALHIAASSADTKIVEVLMENGADLGILDTEGRSALHYAGEKHTESTINLFLDKGMAVNVRDRNGATPLHLALRSGSHNNMKMLLQYGADPHLEDDEKNKALHHASNSWRLSEDTIEILIEAGVNINAQNESGKTPLHLALNNGKSEVVNLFWKYGADPHIEDNEKNNALHHASNSWPPCAGTVKKIIEAGVNINAQNRSGETALHLALNNGKSEVVNLFWKYGADPHIEDNEENNAFHHASNSWRLSEDTIKILIEAGVSINAQNRSGETPLHLASNNERGSAVVKLLLKYGADPHLEDDEKNNALHHASKSRRPSEDTVKKLIEAGVNINARNESGKTPLHLVHVRDRFVRYKIMQLLSDPSLSDDGKKNKAKKLSIV